MSAHLVWEMTMERKITAIVQQKRNHERVNIFLDGEYAFGLARIVAAWLQVGQYLNEDKIADLQAEDDREVAHHQALKLIEFRERSSAEIRRHLNKRQISDDVIDDVIDRLHRSDLVDDSRFASHWIENRTEFRPRGRRALYYELRQKGISEEIIRKTLEQYDDETMAYRAALKQSKKYDKLEWQDYRKKMTGFLTRRGFSYDITAPVVARVWEEKNLQNLTEDSF